MGKRRFGPDNPNWKGGRVVDPRGYVLIRVGVDHPLADVRGYAYEHRLIAYNEGRLKPGDKLQVHHADEKKGNNSSSNLELLTVREHRVKHRCSGRALRLPDEDNPTILCECKCGGSFLKYDNAGRPR